MAIPASCCSGSGGMLKDESITWRANATPPRNTRSDLAPIGRRTHAAGERLDRRRRVLRPRLVGDVVNCVKPGTDSTYGEGKVLTLVSAAPDHANSSSTPHRSPSALPARIDPPA